MTNDTETSPKRGVIRSAVYLVACVGMIGLGVYVLGGGLVLQGCQIRQSENRLQHRQDYSDIAKACAQLFKRLGTNEEQHFNGADPALPESIRQLQSSYVYAFTNQVKITFGGGFHHWGLFYADHLQLASPQSLIQLL